MHLFITQISGQPECNKAIYHRLTQLRAYKLWEDWGRPEGRDFELWLTAERQMVPRIGPYRWVQNERTCYMSNIYIDRG